MKILMVCLGNICRSPGAEAIFNHMIDQERLSNDVSCSSAGMIGAHAGESADPRMIEHARKRGYTINSIARKFNPKSDFDKYDYIIIDCAPSLGLLTLNALTAADSVVIPIQCEYFALEGLGKLLNTIKSVQKIHNPELDIEGLLLTMFDSRLRLSNQVVEEVQKHFNNMVFETIIQRNTKLSEAPSYGESIINYDATSKGAMNYLSLALEIIKKNAK